jgi:hypothetical protein
MNDSLKERLQAAALYGAPISYDIVREAAQAISTLEAERDRLRGALAEARGTLAALSSGEFRDTAWRGVERIDAALNPTGVGEAG